LEGKGRVTEKGKKEAINEENMKNDDHGGKVAMGC